jgi:hypothetical protein
MKSKPTGHLFSAILCLVLGIVELHRPAVAAIVNPSFELGLGGWLHDGNTYPVGSISSPVGVEGYSVANLGTFNQVGSFLSQNVSIFAGGNYRLHYALGANGGNSLGRVAAVRLLITSPQGSILATTVSSAISQGPVFGALGFQTFYADFSVPPEGTVALVRFDDVSPSNGYSVDPMIDAVRLEMLFPPAVPVISLHPLSQTVAEGNSVRLTVSAIGGLPMFYQWYRNSEPIPGANGPTLVLDGVSSAQTGLYWATVQNASGLVSSDKANLWVLPQRNLIVNGNFEADFQGWQHDASAVITWGGNLAQKGVNLGTFDQPNSFLSQSFQVDPCGDYFLSMQLAVNAANTVGRAAALEVSVVTHSGVILFSNVVGLTSAPGGPSFTRYQFQFAPPLISQQASLRLRDVSPNSGIGVDVVVDDVHLNRLPERDLYRRVVPVDSGLVDGPGASAVLSVPIRYQEVYSASEFPSRPILISELRFRPDSRLSSGPFSGQLSYVEVRFSSTLRPVGQLSLRFEENFSSDVSVVYASSWTISTESRSLPDGTRKFDIVLPLQIPFLYDPSKGNLLVEVKNYSSLSSRLHVDSATGSSGVSRIYSDGSPSALIASVGDSSPDVLEFGYCYETPLVPSIVSQPSDQLVGLGERAIFRVEVTGDGPINYQWYKGSAPLAGQTNATLVFASVSSSDAANYFVVVSGAGSSVASSPAALKVRSSNTIILVRSASSSSGSTFTAQVDLESLGVEAGLGFSLSFDPMLMTYESLIVSAQTNGIATSINTNKVAEGKLGVAMVLPVGRAFPTGKQQLMEISFRAASVDSNVLSRLEFADDPVRKEVVDSRANLLESLFYGADIAIGPRGLEGDVSPVVGDGFLTIADWIAMGRLVAGLEVPANESHFRKADCAPRSTLGDGLLTIKDWVQSGRFAAGLDLPQQVGGPDGGVIVASASLRPSLNLSQAANVSIASGELDFGSTLQVPVQLTTSDPTAALGFSIRFDPSVVRFLDLRLGRNAQSGFVNVNDLQASEGYLGVALAFPSSIEIAGDALELVLLRFEVVSDLTAESLLSFVDTPIRREVVTSQAEETASTFTDGILKVYGTPKLSAKLLGDGTVEVSWEGSSSSGSLQYSESLTDVRWQAVSSPPERVEGRMVVKTGAAGGGKIYRLFRP